MSCEKPDVINERDGLEGIVSAKSVAVFSGAWRRMTPFIDPGREKGRKVARDTEPRGAMRPSYHPLRLDHEILSVK